MIETDQTIGPITTEVFCSTLYNGGENKKLFLECLNYSKEGVYKPSLKMVTLVGLDIKKSKTKNSKTISRLICNLNNSIFPYKTPLKTVGEERS